jgi:type I restriction enzyme S subunit
VRSAKSRFRTGDVLYGKLRPYLDKAVLTTGEGICSTDILVLRPDGRIEPTFLVNLVHSRPFIEHALKTTHGVNHPRTSWSGIGKFEFSLPPLLEQSAIAHVLQGVQKAKDAQQRELALERERKAALMEHLLTYGTSGKKTKHTEIGDIPENWEVVPLGKVCKESAFGPRFGAELYSERGNVDVLRTTDIDDDGNIDYATVPSAQLDLSKFKSHVLEEGDFLITRSGTCGVASVFEGHSREVLPGAFLIRFRLSSELLPQFLRHYINARSGRGRVQKLASGAIQKNLTSTSLLSFRIPLPTLAEQELINEAASCCNKKIRGLETEIWLLDELFLGMLEQLMSGRLSAMPLEGAQNR